MGKKNKIKNIRKKQVEALISVCKRNNYEMSQQEAEEAVRAFYKNKELTNQLTKDETSENVREEWEKTKRSMIENWKLAHERASNSNVAARNIEMVDKVFPNVIQEIDGLIADREKLEIKTKELSYQNDILVKAASKEIANIYMMRKLPLSLDESLFMAKYILSNEADRMRDPEFNLNEALDKAYDALHKSKQPKYR